MIERHIVMLVGVLAAGYGLYKLDLPWLTFAVGMIVLLVAFASGLPSKDDSKTDRAIQIAQIVSDHWRNHALEHQQDAGWAHSLCCVQAALDGVDDPSELGIDGSSDAIGHIRKITKQGWSL